MKRKSIVTRLLSIIAIVAVAFAMAQAQPRGPGNRGGMEPEERLEARLEFLTKELGLNEQQAEAVKAAMEKGRSDAEAWHEAHNNATRDDRRAFRDENRAGVESAIEAVLTDDQKATFDELKKRRGRMGPGRRNRGDGPGMGARLDLSDQQRADLDSIRDALQDEVATWKENNPNPTREETAAFWREHRAKRIGLMSEVLDSEQMVALERGMKGGRRAFGKRAKRAGFGQGIRSLDLSEEQMESFRGILTSDQNEKLDRMLAPRGPRFGADRGEKMKRIFDQLDLTEAQKTQLQTMRDNHRAAARAWHDANPNATRAERRAFRDAHREGMKAQLRTVLTDEQMQELESLRDEHRDCGSRGMHGHGGRHG